MRQADRLAAAPRDPADARRAVSPDTGELVVLVPCWWRARKVAKVFTVRFEQLTCHVRVSGKGCCAAVKELRRGRKLPVRLPADGGKPPQMENGGIVRLPADRAKALPQSRRLPEAGPAASRPGRCREPLEREWCRIGAKRVSPPCIDV